MFKKLSVRLTAGIILILIIVTICCIPVYVHVVKDAYISQEVKQMNAFYEELVKITFLKTEDSINEINSLNGIYNYNVTISDSKYNDVYRAPKRSMLPYSFENFSEDAVPEYVKTPSLEGVILRKIEIQNDKKYYITIRKSLKLMDSILAYTNRNMMIIIVFYMVVSGVALVFLVNKSIRPIKQISKIAEQVAQKDYSVRYEGKDTKDEIGQLAKNINKMVDTIEKNINSLNNYYFLLEEDLNYMTKYYEVRKDVVSQITHELKTPLAVISSQVEMMNCSQDEKKKQFYYTSTIEEIEKMSEMIKKILNYSINEQGIFDGEIKKIDLSQFIKELSSKRKNHILSNAFNFETNIQNGCFITSSENHILHVFNNYISNAMNHTVPGGKISVSLKKYEDKIRLSVYNEGSQISNENKDEIWNKFFTSYSNSSDKGDVHAGIGLFIVKEISILEHTKCGFENLKDGVEFWFDFNCDS